MRGTEPSESSQLESTVCWIFASERARAHEKRRKPKEGCNHTDFLECLVLGQPDALHR